MDEENHKIKVKNQGSKWDCNREKHQPRPTKIDQIQFEDTFLPTENLKLQRRNKVL